MEENIVSFVGALDKECVSEYFEQLNGGLVSYAYGQLVFQISCGESLV